MLEKKIIEYNKMSLQIIQGEIRAITDEELESNPEWKNQGYCWVVISNYVYCNGPIIVTVPEGFLTDGSSGGPDYGCSWLFHDWLYSSHKYDDGTECTRQEADEIMRIVLHNERLNIYLSVFNFITRVNCCCCFSTAWENSGERGAQFLK